jgi:CspA family cold shock protein
MEDKLMHTGIVIFFSPKRGFGFLDWSIDGVKQKDLFVHYSDLAMDGFKTLHKDQTVSFNVGKNKHGIDKAIDVIVLK